MKLRALSLCIVLAAAANQVLADDVVASVNDRKLFASQLGYFVKASVDDDQKDTPELRKNVKESWITRTLLAQEAERSGIANRPEVKLKLENGHDQILMRQVAKSYVAKHVTESDIQAAVAREKAAHPNDDNIQDTVTKKLQQEAFDTLVTELKAKAKIQVNETSDAVQASVNGRKLLASQLEIYVKTLLADGRTDTPQLRKDIKDNWITKALFVQEAEKQGIANQPEVKVELELLHDQTLGRALVQDYVPQHITEKNIQAAVAREKAARANDKEYLARHILVATESEANGIIEKLHAGEKFESLARISKDPASAINGGAMDWAPPSNYVKEFADALVTLKVGQTTAHPVKTQYGYHIIRVDDIRPLKWSAEDIQKAATQKLQKETVEKLVADLKAKAKIIN